MNSWPKVPLGKCAYFREGYVNPPQTNPEYFDGPVKWLRAIDLNDSFVDRTTRTLTREGFASAGKSALLFKRNSLAISKSGTIGRLGILRDEMCGNRAVINIEPITSVCDTRFLFYSLLHNRDRIVLLADGSVQKNLYVSALSSVEIALPSLAEQQRIGAFLRAFDDKIELNRRLNETLTQIAKALFKSWFVDFEPVHAKAAHLEKGFPKHVADLFPARFIESELGKIPEGWTVARIADMSVVNGWTLGRKDPITRIDYIEISEVNRGEVNAIQLYERGTEPSRARRRLRHGDTVLSTVRPDRGSYFLAIDPPETLIASTGFATFSPKNQECWPLLHCVLTSPRVGEELGRIADGGAYPAVSPEQIAKLTCAMPRNESLQISFSHSVAPLFKRADLGRRMNRVIAELRDALLSKLISGEIRFKEAEKIAGVAL